MGWTFHGNDPATLADLMKLAIENTPERIALVHAAKKSAMERFDLAQMVDRFQSLYLEMLSGQKQIGPANMENKAPDAMRAIQIIEKPSLRNSG